MWTCCGRGEDEAACGLSHAGRSRWRSMLAELKRRTPDTLERVNAEFEARVKAIRIDDGSHVGTKLVTVGAVPLRTAVAACRHAGGDSLHTSCDCVYAPRVM